MMASFMGLSALGSKGSPLRTFSTLSLHASARSLTRSVPFRPGTQTLRGSHPTSGRLLLIATRPSSSLPSSSALEEHASTADDAFVTPTRPLPVRRRFPILSPKEKKELRAYAHSLGKKIVSQQIGKAGVTESLAKAISDALEAKEILKLKILDNCPDDLDIVIAKIEEATQGQVVGKIGSVITLYRPSLRKLSEAGKSVQNKGLDGRPRRTMVRRM